MKVYVLSEIFDNNTVVMGVFTDEKMAREMPIKWAHDDGISDAISAEDAYCPEEYFSILGNQMTNEEGREVFEYCCEYRVEAFDLIEVVKGE